MSCKRVIITEFGGPEVLKVVEEAMLPEPELGEVRVKGAGHQRLLYRHDDPQRRVWRPEEETTLPTGL